VWLRGGLAAAGLHGLGLIDALYTNSLNALGLRSARRAALLSATLLTDALLSGLSLVRAALLRRLRIVPVFVLIPLAIASHGFLRRWSGARQRGCSAKNALRARIKRRGEKLDALHYPRAPLRDLPGDANQPVGAKVAR
jgi:hypothetical protein